MKTENISTPPRSWINVPVIGLVAQILCRELVLQNEYLRTENRILKSKVSKRLSFTDDERRTLVDAAMVLGKKLMHDRGEMGYSSNMRIKPWTILLIMLAGWMSRHQQHLKGIFVSRRTFYTVLKQANLRSLPLLEKFKPLQLQFWTRKETSSYL